MLSYLNDKKLKTAIVKEMKEHQKHDQFIKGSYGKENGIFKGCSVGCAVHSLNRIKGITIPYGSHSRLAEAIGIPEWLWLLNDTLFENLPDGENSQFSVDFLNAVPVGVDLTSVRWKFCAFILKENIERVLLLDIKDEIKKQVVDAIRGVLVLHEEAIKTRSAAESAWSAAESAWSAVRSAASSAARLDAYQRYAKELLKLLSEAK